MAKALPDPVPQGFFMRASSWSLARTGADPAEGAWSREPGAGAAAGAGLEAEAQEWDWERVLRAGEDRSPFRLPILRLPAIGHADSFHARRIGFDQACREAVIPDRRYAARRCGCDEGPAIATGMHKDISQT